MKSCHELLRELREDNDLKQSDIAEIIGTTQQQYSKYETGETEPSLRVLSILADYYKVSADYLMGRKDCLNGVPGLDIKLVAEHTIGEVLTDILSLNKTGRASVVEYISLQKLKENCTKKKAVDGEGQ